MNRRELVNAVAAHTGMEPKEIDVALKGVTDVLTAAVSKGEVVAISGFAKFAKVSRPARMGRNPATGAAIKIAASTKPRVTMLKAFKDSVMTPSLAPKLAPGVLGATKAPAKKATAATKAPAKKAAAPAKKAAAKKAPAKKASAAKKR